MGFSGIYFSWAYQIRLWKFEIPPLPFHFDKPSLGLPLPIHCSPIADPYHFWCDLCLLKIWSKTRRSCSHTSPCVICSWPHFITPAKAITQSWWVKSASWAYMGGEEISAESLLKQEKNIFHEGNRIWGAFSMKKELHEPNLRHKVWSGRVLRCAERIGSLGRGQRPDACS